MVKKKNIRIWSIVFAVIGVCILGFLLYDNGRPIQFPTKEHLYSGVDYSRKVSISPRPMIIHEIKIDLSSKGLRFLVTPPDEVGTQYPLRARTTSQFLHEFGVQIAINGDGFKPWWSHSPLDYYPHDGDPVEPLGETASQGVIYQTSSDLEPTLYISSNNRISLDAPARPFNAISGKDLLVMGGHPILSLDSSMLQPRTAIGYSANGRFLYLVVVDGRQPFYSEGITLIELAHLMVSLGSAYAINLDGGGSSTMVIVGSDGRTHILNSPIDSLIPGRERPVADHLGIYVTK
jgi:hypothetical protein